MKAYSKVFCPTTKQAHQDEDDDTMVELVDFEDVVQQGNHAENFLKHKIKASDKLVHQLDITCASNLLPSSQLQRQI